MDPSTIARLGQIRHEEIVAWAAQQRVAYPASTPRWTVRRVLAHLWPSLRPVEGPVERSARVEPLRDMTAHERYN
jgi:hypothetical protein